MLTNEPMERTAIRAAADAERQAHFYVGLN